MMSSLLILGLGQLGNDIDVYLASLLEYLKTLWDVGIQAYNGHQQEFFILWVVLLWIINDFPTCGNLPDWTVKGYFAYPICGE